MQHSRPNRARIIAGWTGLAVLAFFLRLPSFTDAFFDPDVAATVYMSQVFMKGGCLYPDVVETKPPGAHLIFGALFAAGLNMAGVHLFLVLYHLLIALMLSSYLRSVHGSTAGWWAAVLYLCFSVGGFIEGFAPNYETWALIWLAGVMLALERGISDLKTGWWLAAGMAAGAAALMKQQALLIGMPLGVLGAVYARHSENGPSTRRFIRVLALFGGGACLPWAAIFIALAVKGCPTVLIDALNPWRGVGYFRSSEWGEIARCAIEQTGLFLRFNLPLVLLALGGLAALRGQRRIRWTLGLWLVGAAAAVAVGGKFFNHYYVFLISPLAVCGGVCVAEMLQSVKSLRFKTILTIGLIIFIAAGLWRDVVFAEMALKSGIREGRVYSRETFRFFRRQSHVWLSHNIQYPTLEWELEAQRAGAFIRDRSGPDDSILVYDYFPSIYWYARRLAPTRHHVNFEVAFELPEYFGRWYKDLAPQVAANRVQMMQQLKHQPPKFFIQVKNWRETGVKPRNIYGDPLIYPDQWRTPLFPELSRFIKEYYAPAAGAENLAFEILEHQAAAVK